MLGTMRWLLSCLKGDLVALDEYRIQLVTRIRNLEQLLSQYDERKL